MRCAGRSAETGRALRLLRRIAALKALLVSSAAAVRRMSDWLLDLEKRMIRMESAAEAAVPEEPRRDGCRCANTRKPFKTWGVKVVGIGRYHDSRDTESPIPAAKDAAEGFVE